MNTTLIESVNYFMDEFVGKYIFNSKNELCIIKTVDHDNGYIEVLETNEHYKVHISNINRNFKEKIYKLATEIDRLLYV